MTIRLLEGTLPLLVGAAMAAGLLAIAPRAVTDTQIAVVSQNALDGTTIELPVLIDSTEDVAAVQFDLRYNMNRFASGTAQLPGALGDFEVRSRNLAPGTVRIIVFSRDNRPMPNAVFVSIPLDIFEGVPRGSNPMILENVVPANVTATLVDPLEVVSGNLVIGPVGPVSLGSVFYSPDGMFEVELSGVFGRQFTVDASENLTDWEPIFSGTAATDTFQFVDPDAGAFSRRFYRVRLGDN